MPRSGGGVYSLPAGLPVNGETSNATDDIRTPFSDIEADLNTARPVVAGGTGATTAAGALFNFGLTATAAEINVLDGVTASTAEINVLDGLTPTTTELNYVDGVTSAIQTQLNAKQASDATLTSLSGLSLSSGDVLYATAADTLARLAIGTTGQTLIVSGGLPAWGSAGNFTFATPIATTSGTNHDFTGIPAGVTEIEVVFRGTSLSGTDNILVQLGTSGGFVSTGYESYNLLGIGGSSSSGSSTAGMIAVLGNAAYAITGTYRLIRSTANTWTGTLSGSNTANSLVWDGGGDIALAAALTQVRITRTGANTFDAGTVTVGYR